MTIDLYRQTQMGDCLVEALEELMAQEKISEELANTICQQFDNTMLDALHNQVTGKAVIKANLKTYRYYDGVWQFNLEDVSFKLSNTGTGSMSNIPEIKCEKAKIICVDTNLVYPEEKAQEKPRAGEP